MKEKMPSFEELNKIQSEHMTDRQKELTEAREAAFYAGEAGAKKVIDEQKQLEEKKIQEKEILLNRFIDLFKDTEYFDELKNLDSINLSSVRMGYDKDGTYSLSVPYLNLNLSLTKSRGESGKASFNLIVNGESKYGIEESDHYGSTPGPMLKLWSSLSLASQTLDKFKNIE